VEGMTAEAAPTSASADRKLVVTGRLDPDQVAEVLGIVDAATRADGVGPLSEHVRLHLRYGGDAPVRNLLLYAGDRLAGYAHLDVTDPVEGSSSELVVDPAYRHHGHARALVARLITESPDGRLRLWAHGAHPDAARLAASMGFERSRELWQMRRALAGDGAAPLPDVPLPPGVSVRTFVPGQDDEPWVALNGRAFAEHPEQGRLSVSDLHQRMREAWFDPAGFFLAEKGGELVGFHWTKVHGGDGPPERQGHGHDPLGEVYVVGVDPAQQGAGLGRALTVIGLRHLQEAGLPEAMLYVDADNSPAIRVYTALGFAHVDTDVMFSRSPDAVVPAAD
jgi:mycothiol synthase